jgi:hypothetical protein
MLLYNMYFETKNEEGVVEFKAMKFDICQNAAPQSAPEFLKGDSILN